MILLDAPCAAAPRTDHGPPGVHWQDHPTALKYQGTKFRKATREKDVGPTRGFAASPEVGLGATVGTPRTSSKSGRRAIRALKHAHVSMTLDYVTRHRQLGCLHTSCGVSSHLLAQVPPRVSWP
jgi:hypothetical protein